MHIIIGLGNPGGRFDGTRHNIGFELIDYLSRAYHIPVKKIKHKALIGEGSIDGHKVVLVKPQTFMNLSGEAVQSVMHYYKVPLTHVLVVYDDIDLDPGKLRIRHKGSAGTHNGMRSIVSHLKSEDFPRMRLGVGKSEIIPLEKFVLMGFSKEEIPLMEDAIIRGSKAVKVFVSETLDKAMNAYNG
jgi:PTH1 family peptidyl-tRNA hydrolase